MNVTIKIDDTLCKLARHRAVDQNLSLSGWIAELIAREVQSRSTTKPKTKAPRLVDLLGDETVADIAFEAPHFSELPRSADLRDEVPA